MSIHGKITLHCTGCRRCITEAAQDPGKASQRWWENWIGKREQPGDQKRRKYANVLNDECGKQMELKLNPADVIIQNLNNGVRSLETRMFQVFIGTWRTSSPDNRFFLIALENHLACLERVQA